METSLKGLVVLSMLSGCGSEGHDKNAIQEPTEEIKALSPEELQAEVVKDRQVQIVAGKIIFRATDAELGQTRLSADGEPITATEDELSTVTACNFKKGTTDIKLKKMRKNVQVGLQNETEFDKRMGWPESYEKVDCSRFDYQVNPTQFSIQAFPGAKENPTLVQEANGMFRVSNNDKIKDFLLAVRKHEKTTAFASLKKSGDIDDEFDKNVTSDYMFAPDLEVDTRVEQVCLDARKKSEIDCIYSPDSFVRTSHAYSDLETDSYRFEEPATGVENPFIGPEVPGINKIMPGSIARAYFHDNDDSVFARITEMDQSALNLSGEIWYRDYRHTSTPENDLYLVQKFQDITYDKLSALMRENRQKEIHTLDCQRLDTTNGAFNY